MSFERVPGDNNEYNGAVLRLIADTVTDLALDYRVTELYGDKNRPCTIDVRKKLKSVTFPVNSKLEKIQPYAFYNCEKITEIDLINCKNLHTIGDYSFAVCKGLSKITLPKSKLTTICESGFRSCGLKSIIIPYTVTTVAYEAFSYCLGLKTLEFETGSQLTTITKHLLCYTDVESFIIRKNVNTINQGAFEAAKSLKYITVETGNQNFKSESNGLIQKQTDGTFSFFVTIPNALTGEYTVPGGITILGSSAFYRCYLTKVTIPEGVITIDWCCFTDSHDLKEVILPDSITDIKECAFTSCSSIESIKLPANLKNLYRGVFSGCRFSKVEVPNGVEALPDDCFSENPNLTEIILPANLKTLGGNVFPQNDFLNITFDENSPFKITPTMIIMDKKETYIVQYLGKHPNFVLELPKTMKVIKSRAFEYKTNLTEIKFPEGSEFREVQKWAFKGCKNLKGLTFPAKFQKIDEQGFYECNALENLVFENCFYALGEEAFKLCCNLKSVDFHNTQINNVPKEIFFGCTNLETVIFPPRGLYFKENCFYHCGKLSTITIPETATILEVGIKSFCETAIKSFIFPTPSTVTTIGDCAFYYCTSLETVTLCNSITKICYCAFAKTKLTTVPMTANINTLGDLCFSDCPEIKEFILPENSALTQANLGLGIFRRCKSFENIVSHSEHLKESTGILFSKDLTTILMFPPASKIAFLPIPDTVTRIGNGAFYDCIHLRSILIPEINMTTIGNYAFEDARSIHYINIPKCVLSVGSNAFRGCIGLQCGIDVDSTDVNFINSLVIGSKLPQKALLKCIQITCKKSKTNIKFSKVLLFSMSGLQFSD